MPSRILLGNFRILDALFYHCSPAISAGEFHLRIDLLGVPPLRVVADQDRLAEGDTVGDGIDRGLGPVGFRFPLVAVLFEPLGPLLGQACIFVVDLAAEFEEQILPLRRPHGRYKEFLFRRPLEPGRLHAVVGLLPQPRDEV
jgi:hypothetical protein